jgi:hypothetical protein
MFIAEGVFERLISAFDPSLEVLAVGVTHHRGANRWNARFGARARNLPP